MEDPSSIKYLEAIQEAMTDIKGKKFQFLSDRDHLFELVEMYHDASLRDVEEIEKLTLELDSTQDSLKSTHSALQESKIQIEQHHKKLSRSHSSSYIFGIWMIAFMDQRRNLM